MNHYKNLKEFIFTQKLRTPEDFYRKAEEKIKRMMPFKIPRGEWVNLSATRQFCVFPYEPIPSALRGGMRMAEFVNYPELRRVYQWRWEYFHDHGDALKIGKSGGLYILDEDPLIVPGLFVYLLYFLIYKTQPQDYSNLNNIRANIQPNF